MHMHQCFILQIWPIFFPLNVKQTRIKTKLYFIIYLIQLSSIRSV